MNLSPLSEKFIHYSLFEKNSNTSNYYIIIIIIKLDFSPGDMILNVKSILYIVYVYSK